RCAARAGRICRASQTGRDRWGLPAARRAPDRFGWLAGPRITEKHTARALCRRFQKGIHVPVDDLWAFVASGGAPLAEWTAEAARQFALSRKGHRSSLRTAARRASRS